jgi:hypothetical protein
MLFCFWNCYFLEITSQTWRQKILNKLLVISCIHLEEQTKDILKLKSVSNTTIRDVAKHLTFGGRGGGWRIIRVIIIIKLFVIDWHSHGRKGGCLSGGHPPENFYIFEALGLNFWRFLKQIRKQISCKLTVFYKNGYHFTKRITLLRKF